MKVTKANGKSLSQAAALAWELGSTGGIAFHLAAGFAEANRIVCFVKSMGEENE